MSWTRSHCATAALFVTTHIVAQSIDWRQASTSGPGLGSPAMAYDSQRTRTVLFGNSARTHEWNGSTWTHPSLTGAIPRPAAIAFDSQAMVTVIYDGSTTWYWNGAYWRYLLFSGGPTVTQHALAYDAVRGRLVLFGGMSNSGSLLGDTWEWNQVAWQQVATSGPPARIRHALAHDRQRGRTVLFGGSGAAGTFLDDTWEWDGAIWRQLVAGVPTPRADHAMAHDSLRGRTVLFGGSGVNGALLGDTWEWDGSTWLIVDVTGPPARGGHALAYDSSRSRVVLHGGVGVGGIQLRDTWERGIGVHAMTIPFGYGCGSPPLTIAGVTRPILGLGQITDIRNIPGFVAFMTIGFSKSVIGVYNLPIRLDVFGMSLCVLLHDMAYTMLDPCSAPLAGTAVHTVQIPNTPALQGVHVYFQAWADAPAGNAFGVISSNALDLLLGNI